MSKNKLIKKLTLCTIVLLAVFGAQSVFAQTTAFTYQGKLNDGANPANAGYDMQFRLFDLAGAGQGTQQGATITISPVAVSNGNFAVSLDFGAAVFASGADRFLEISLRPAGNTGGYTSLAPRQKLTSSPYAVRSVNANSADTLSTACVGCVQNSNINSVDGNKVTGTVANATNATNAVNATNSTNAVNAVNATNATNATTATTATTAGNVSGIVAIENGGTGSATQNFVDLSTDQTIDGNKAFNGIVSASALSGDGSGLNNLFQIQTFGGSINNIPPNSSVFYFQINLTTTVTVNGSQRITGSASASLASSNASADFISVNLCYQNTSDGVITRFSNNSMVVTILQRGSVSVSNSVIPPTGEYRVGVCIVNGGGQFLNVNGNLQGWIMITNN